MRSPHPSHSRSCRPSASPVDPGTNLNLCLTIDVTNGEEGCPSSPPSSLNAENDACAYGLAALPDGEPHSRLHPYRLQKL